MTRAEIAAALRELGLYVVSNGFAAGHLDAEYVLAHIEIYCWNSRGADWQAEALPVTTALRDLTPAGCVR